MGLPRFLVDENGNYLIEKHRLILLSSGRDLVLPPLIEQATAPVILAAPLYDESQAERYAVTANQGAATTTAKSLSALYFSPLPGALKEGEILKALFANRQQAVDYYELASATGPTLKRIVSPHILHLATHGFFLEDLHRHEESETGLDKGVSSVLKNVDTGNPLLRSGLALVNANLAVKAANDDQAGILSAEEVLDLQLAGTKLVVLSACNTGVGKIQTGEGVYGLRRAFQEAGAQSVLSTLWAISDEGTLRLMAHFYRRFLDGMAPQEALRQTQLAFIKSKVWRHPFYWAPFAMVGK